MATKPKSKPKAVKACDCLGRIDKALRDQTGAKFVQSLRINFATGKSSMEGPFLAVEWVDGKPKGSKRLPTFVCTYCPFCGKKKA